jgi:hypothetical protein
MLCVNGPTRGDWVFGRLITLRKLDLYSKMELTALPEGLCSLVGLEVLDMFSCGLAVLPEEIEGLAGIKNAHSSQVWALLNWIFI